MSRKDNSVFLEVDRSIIEHNLLIKEDNDGLEELFPTQTPQESEDVTWKLVTPTPGICVKTHSKDGGKVFINICETSDVPAPKDIDQETLANMWSSEDQPSFRIPMSIGEGHEEADKAGNPAIAYDVAINPEFHKETVNSKLFLSFLLTTVIEALSDKYSLNLQTDDYVLLKNRKVMGNLLPHRIRQTRQGGQTKQACPLIQEMTPPAVIPSCQPEYRIRHEPPEAEFPDYLLVEFSMKGVSSSHGLTLDVGEDRIVLDSPGRIGQQAYKLDVFIPYSVHQGKCSATFNTDTKILSLRIPVIIPS